MEKLDKKQKLGVLAMVAVIAGIFGWVYEFIFYYFNYGRQGWFLQGGNFLPWINIYAIGAILILGLTYKIREKPFLVFLVSVVSTGILEYFSGLVIFELTGQRFWDYNVEILNFGNIGGFICLRSVLFFGLSGLILTYLILPMVEKIAKRMRRKAFLILAFSLLGIILADEFYNLIVARIFDLPRAIEVYQGWGLKYRP